MLEPRREAWNQLFPQKGLTLPTLSCRTFSLQNWEALTSCCCVYLLGGHSIQQPSTFRGKGNGNPLQYSCLENPVDRVAWWAAVYGVAQSRTRLKQLSSSSTSSSIFISMILSQFIPPSPYPTVSTDLFLCLASLFLPCKIGSIFLNRFHIYVLT